MSLQSRVSPRNDSGIFMYVRRVPKEVAQLDRRGTVRQSLNTRDLVRARKKAAAIDDALERYWSALLSGSGAAEALDRYDGAVALARSLGFLYRPIAELLNADTAEIVGRAEAIADRVDEPHVVAAVMGGVERPQLSFSSLWEAYFRQRSVELSGLSPRQLEKHRKPRERAIATLIEVLSDKELRAVSGDDVLRYRDWWTDRIRRNEVTARTANRLFSDIKGMMTIVDGALGTDHVSTWRPLRIRPPKREKKLSHRTRPPYPFDFVQNKLLAPDALAGLNREARLIVYTIVETGLRLSEACNLRPQDIHLDAEIPFISISERVDREQKTEYSIRQIPLVGVSLWALKHARDGFPRYHDKGDSLSAAVNKFLSENDLRPTPKHSIYSLRHTFQDRLLAAEAPDRLQTALMGHDFDRPVYGEGPSMRQKADLLEKIAFEWIPASS